MKIVPDKNGRGTVTLHLQTDPRKKLRWFEYRVYVSHGTRTEARKTFVPGWSAKLEPVLAVARKLGGTHVILGPTRVTL